MKCWWCGAEPSDVLDITQLGDAEPRLLPVWAPSDHDCAVCPPTPGEMLEAGAWRFDRIVRIASE